MAAMLYFLFYILLIGNYYICEPRRHINCERGLSNQARECWNEGWMRVCEQGRCTWWNPATAQQRGDEEEGEEGGGEGADEAEQAEPESGPPLLTPLSEDTPIENMSPWTPSASSKLLGSSFSIAVLRSNLWPGSCAFAVPSKRAFENIYVGACPDSLLSP